MQSKKLKLSITLFALLAFIGQAMAAVNASCSITDADSSTAVQMADMSHADHPLHELPDVSYKDNMSSIDCCEEVDCTVCQCAGFSTLNITPVLQVGSYGTDALITRRSFLYLPPEALSIFRPPINS